jgi:hypothetical protein
MCKRVADRVYKLGIKFFDNIESQDLMSTIAPLVTDSIYQAAVIYGLLAQAAGDRSYHDAYELLRRSLKYFDRRWKVVGMSRVGLASAWGRS